MVNKKNTETKPETINNIPTKEASDPLAEMTDLLKRTQANFENYQKQQEKRNQEFREFANKELILQILPVIDNFELALKNTQSHQKEFIKGIELIYNQLNQILEDQGVQPILTKNQIFDPYFHEALMKEPSDKSENTITEEFQKGFTLNNQVIRHAKVKVSAGPKEKNTKEKPNNNNNNNNNNNQGGN